MSHCTRTKASITTVCSFPKVDLLGLHMPLHMHVDGSADVLHDIHNCHTDDFLPIRHIKPRRPER